MGARNKTRDTICDLLTLERIKKNIIKRKIKSSLSSHHQPEFLRTLNP